jgi:hypothetical protein
LALRLTRGKCATSKSDNVFGPMSP